MKTRLFVILSMVIINFIALSCNVGKFVQQQYLKKTLHPVYLGNKVNFKNPDEYHINGIPCISYQNAYCASAALQMVAEQKGIVKNIDYINWLMGFTYSFYFFSKYSFALPYFDPETGYVNASPYLGLKRNYLVTNDSSDFINNLKEQLSLNIPVRIALNSSTLYDIKGFTPHSILIVGYTKDSIYYYETGIKDRRIFNYNGEKVEIGTFIRSVRSIANYFNYPWLYNMTVFDSGIRDNDFNKVWMRNGKYMIGKSIGPMSTGSKGIKNFSEYLKNNELKDWQFNQFAMLLEMGIYTRFDNSSFIRTNFPGRKFQEVANLFSKSSDLFKEAKQAMQQKEKNTAAEKLIKISEIEFSIGKLLTDKK